LKKIPGGNTMLKEFRDFAVRGNVIDLAVAVIIGGAFGKIVGSLVNDILMPLIGLALGGVNFAELSVTVGEAVIKWGAFVQAIIDFVVIAFVIFLIVRAANKTKKEEPAPAPAAPTTKECPFCLTEIAIKASRCPNCTSQL
jgi:large conductance mechanosensitive channel